jgi:hypothetical protein
MVAIYGFNIAISPGFGDLNPKDEFTNESWIRDLQIDSDDDSDGLRHSELFRRDANFRGILASKKNLTSAQIVWLNDGTSLRSKYCPGESLDPLMARGGGHPSGCSHQLRRP